jgi:hypothetical protein
VAAAQAPDLLLMVSLRSVDLPLEEICRCLAEPAGASRDAMVAKLLDDHRGGRPGSPGYSDLHRLEHMKERTPMGRSTSSDVDHRALGAQLFNETWTYLEKEAARSTRTT